MSLTITVEFDPATHSVTKIHAPECKNWSYLAALLGMAEEQAKFQANVLRAQLLQAQAQQEAAQQQLARQQQECLARKLKLG